MKIIPRGYLEWEAVKKLAKQPELFDDAALDGKAVKVISMLLAGLPRKHNYKLIFMSRPTIEIAASQKRMIERLGTDGAVGELEEITTKLDQHRNQTLKWLESRKFIDFIVVEYPDLVA